MASKISPDKAEKPSEVKGDTKKLLGVSREWPFPANQDGEWFNHDHGQAACRT